MSTGNTAPRFIFSHPIITITYGRPIGAYMGMLTIYCPVLLFFYIIFHLFCLSLLPRQSSEYNIDYYAQVLTILSN